MGFGDFLGTGIRPKRPLGGGRRGGEVEWGIEGKRSIRRRHSFLTPSYDDEEEGGFFCCLGFGGISGRMESAAFDKYVLCNVQI